MTNKIRNTSASGRAWSPAGSARARRGVLTEAGLAPGSLVIAFCSATADIYAIRSSRTKNWTPLARECAEHVSSGAPYHGIPHQLRRDELIPFLHQIVVLIHHGVPARDTPHARFIGAAVARLPGFFQECAIGRLDVLLRRLAFHPVGPLVGLHLGLRGVEHG